MATDHALRLGKLLGLLPFGLTVEDLHLDALARGAGRLTSEIAKAID